MKYTIDQYSKEFKMSKELIKQKIKQKQLNYVIQGDTIYIISNIKNAPTKTKPTVGMIISLYQRENRALKAKIAQLEAKIDKLIDDKEQMLKDEINKIESLYTLKDKQLKSIIDLINNKLSLEQQTIHDVNTIQPIQEADANVLQNETKKIVELKKYLKTLDLKPHQRKVIKKRFLASYNDDVRIIKQNGKLYLDFSKYDYSDLLDY